MSVIRKGGQIHIKCLKSKNIYGRFPCKKTWAPSSSQYSFITTNPVVMVTFYCPVDLSQPASGLSQCCLYVSVEAFEHTHQRCHVNCHWGYLVAGIQAACSMQSGQNSFISWFTNPTTVILRKSRKKSFFYFVLSTDSKCYLFRWRKIIYFWGSVRVFLRVTLLKVIVLSRFF